MGESLTRAEYAACLQRMHGIVSAWETQASRIAPDWLRPLLAARRRTALLEDDLGWLGLAIPIDAHPTLPEMNDGASLFGTMYVMEGSTLGGQLIARHVERVLGLGEGRGNTFFRGHGDRTGPLWKEFCEVLRTRVPESETKAVVRAAKAMFATFGVWMQPSLQTRRGQALTTNGNSIHP